MARNALRQGTRAQVVFRVPRAAPGGWRLRGKSPCPPLLRRPPGAKPCGKAPTAARWTLHILCAASKSRARVANAVSSIRFFLGDKTHPMASYTHGAESSTRHPRSFPASYTIAVPTFQPHLPHKIKLPRSYLTHSKNCSASAVSQLRHWSVRRSSALPVLGRGDKAAAPIGVHWARRWARSSAPCSQPRQTYPSVQPPAPKALSQPPTRSKAVCRCRPLTGVAAALSRPCAAAAS